jgi:hypothetical protein
MSEIKKINEEIEKQVRPSEVRQHYILFKNAEFEILKQAEAKLKEFNIFSKNRVIAIACSLLLEKLKEKDGKEI